jgi:hypothetical protein
MGLIGDFAKGILILTVVCWIFLIIEFTAIGQTILALLLLIGLLIPSSMIIYENKKSKKKDQDDVSRAILRLPCHLQRYLIGHVCSF